MPAADAPSLFPELAPLDDAPAEPHAPRPRGPFAGVVLEMALDRELDYAIPAGLSASLRVGQRVRVPLGRRNKPTLGYVVSIHDTSSYPQIKNLIAIEDARVLVPPSVMRLARWMSRYYCTPLGTVIESVIPSAVKKKIGIGYTPVVRLAQTREQLQEILEKTRAPKRRAILARLLQLEPDHGIELAKLAGESGTTPPTVRKLARLGPHRDHAGGRSPTLQCRRRRAARGRM
jgi:primosomal protein N' (replication factor Y)